MGVTGIANDAFDSNKTDMAQSKTSEKHAETAQSPWYTRKLTVVIACGILVVIIILSVSIWFVTKSVDGLYSNWYEASACTRSCGGGTSTWKRKCDNPSPKNGGKQCQGPAIEIRSCANTFCTGSAGISMTQQLVQDIMLIYQAESNITSSGRFQKVIFTMQRAVANEQAFERYHSSNARSRRDVDSKSFYTSYNVVRTPSERLDDMKKIIAIAVNKTNKSFARSIFAKSLYVYIRKVVDEGMPIKDIARGAQGYLQIIKNAIGEQAFSELMLESGGGTLMFAIDTTGSMAQEINAAKAIATSIVKRKRQFPVDYILSPFNDPSTGPVTYKGPADREEFVSAIANLRATGGGDCPELALKGMLDAFTPEPQLGSPMFVFTDATPKDGTRSNIDKLKMYAKQFSATINFFIKPGCGSSIHSAFIEIASHTSGQIFPLQTDSEIEKFKDYVDDSLKDSVIIAEGKSGSDIFITIDGEITTLLISLEVKQANQAQYVKLVDPFGDILKPTIVTTYTCIFKQIRPMPGTWHMKYPAGIQIKSYSGKSVGNNTIDFAAYFLHEEVKGGPVLSVKSPKLGENSTTMLQVSGAENIESESLLIDILRESGNVLQENLPIDLMPGAKGILRGTINTPNEAFKIQLKGKTKAGQNFTRVSQTSFKASNIVLLTIAAGLDFTATVSNQTAPIRLYLYSKAATGTYNLNVQSTLGSVSVSPSSVLLASGTNTTVTVQHTLPANAGQLIGKMVTITVKVTMAISAEKQEHQIEMMYVP